MQTFLPYADFALSAQILDDKRLGKQRVETWQILNALRGQSKGWVNHPATVMWRGHEQALIHYGRTMCDEWLARGFNDTLRDRFDAELTTLYYDKPWWLGYEPLHISHRSNLYRKDANYYSIFGDEPRDLAYVWCKPDGTYQLGLDKTNYVAEIPA